MQNQRIAGIILAAGNSTRMGKPKALLNIGDSTFLEVIVKNLLDANFAHLMIVLGTEAAAEPDLPPGRGRGVQTLAQYVAGLEQDVRPQTIRPGTIEQLANTLTTDAGRAIQQTGAVVYEAIFGCNHHAPFDPAAGAPWPSGPDAQIAYTPWPSALRITMTLHDAAGRLDAGREVQFVVHLD